MQTKVNLVRTSGGELSKIVNVVAKTFIRQRGCFRLKEFCENRSIATC